MFLYFCSARSSLLLAGRGSSEGSSAGAPVGAVGGAVAASGAPVAPAGSGGAGMVWPESIAGCPGGSACPLLLLLTEACFDSVPAATCGDAPPPAVAQLPTMKPSTSPATIPMSP